MNKSECTKCLAILKQNYTASFSKLDKNDLLGMIELWQLQFKDNSYEEVITAINYIISADTREFAPPIGVIKARITENKLPEQLSTSHAWELVRKNCGRPDGFQRLPKIIQKTVGSSGVLKSWGEANIDVFNSSIMATFRKNYEKAVTEEKEKLSLPNSVKADIARLQKETLSHDVNYIADNLEPTEIERMMLER